jgi:hypothetical protein
MELLAVGDAKSSTENLTENRHGKPGLQVGFGTFLCGQADARWLRSSHIDVDLRLQETLSMEARDGIEPPSKVC